jgi:hypothetical protein
MNIEAFVHKIIKADGTTVDCPPKGKHYTLDELRSAIGGGYIEIVHPRQDPRYLMVIDEEGKLYKGFPTNVRATELAGAFTVGRIVGDVLVCREGDID